MVRIMVSILIALACCQVSLAAKQPAQQPAPYNPYTAAEKQLARQINKTGVAIIKQGDRLKLVIPVDQYFYPASTRVRGGRKRDLQRIALFLRSYIRRYRKPRVLVRGYTDRIFSHKTRQQLSQDYADIIGNYLWTFGVPEKVIQAQGLGAQQPIASDDNPRGAAFNRRVEIIIK